eukprot:COSAG02_NODE_4341_length_5478_cov_14.459007_6_plen_108_part_01
MNVYRGVDCVSVPSSTGAKRPKKPIGGQPTAAISAWATFYRPRPARFGVVGPKVTPLARLFCVLRKLGACRIENAVENPDIPAHVDKRGHDPGVSFISVGDLAKAFYH